MTPKISKKDLNNILNIILKRYKKNYSKVMSAKAKKELVAGLEKAYSEGQLKFDYLPNGKIGYFLKFNRAYMGEFAEHFCLFSQTYCAEDTSMRAKFYRAIKTSSLSMKKNSEKDKKVKRVMVDIDVTDETSKKYFAKAGKLSLVLLVGKTSDGLRALKDVQNAPFRVSGLQKKDVNQAIKLDIESHTKDKTSRMKGPFSGPNAKKLAKGFYRTLLKNKSCIVVKEKKKIAGSTGYFINKNEKLGLVGGIFVTHTFKGRGVSKILYKSLLLEFKKRKLHYYLGATTTDGVLAQAEKMGRKEISRSYIFKI